MTFNDRPVYGFFFYFREDIDWFQYLLRAYDLHMELFLDSCSKYSSLILKNLKYSANNAIS